MSLHDSLEADLKAISVEGRRKSVKIRDTADKLIAELRSSPTIPSESLMAIMDSIKGVGVSKIYIPIINILQKLLTRNLIDGPSILPVLEFLSTVIYESNEEPLQLKSLQTIMLTLNPSAVLLTEELSNVIWLVCISLQGFKSGLVRNAASATLRQLVDISFEKLNKQVSDENEAKGVNDSSLLVIRNVLELVGGNNHLWPGERNKMKAEGVNLLTAIVDSKALMRAEALGWVEILEEVLGVLQEQISEPLEEGYSDQCVYCYSHIMLTLQRGFDVINKFSSFLENKNSPGWIRVACLRAISEIVSKSNKLTAFLANDYLGKMMESVAKTPELFFSEESKQGSLRVKLLAELFSNAVESAMQVCYDQGVKLGEGVVANEVVESVLRVIWRPLQTILFRLLALSLSRAQIQSVLSATENLIKLTGSFNIPQAQESIISSLSSFAMPSSNNLSPKQLLSYRCLLNISNDFHQMIDMKSWHRILTSLQSLNTFLQPCKCECDMNILKLTTESLFTSTSLWPNKTLTDFIAALSQITLEFMEVSSNNEKKTTLNHIFGLEKLLIVTYSNLNRVLMIWDNLIALIDCICSSKLADVRCIGITSLVKLQVKVFKHFVDYPPDVDEASKWNLWQKTLFAALQDSQQEEEIFKGVYTILQSCGGQLDKSGWSVILSILLKTDPSFHSASGYKCLQLIVNDFLQSEQLLACLSKLVELISKFSDSKDIKQSVSAVGMYWNLADYLGRVGREEQESWWLILGKLKDLGQDERPEVRHSALHTLHVALTTHGSCLSQNLWQRIMANIILSLLQKISSTYLTYATLTPEVPILEPANFLQSEPQEIPTKIGKKNLRIAIPTDLALPLVSETPKFAGRLELPKEDKVIVHHSRDTLEKQWEETYHIFTQNLGKLFRTYLSNLEKNDEEVLKTTTVKKNWDLLILRLKEGLHSGTTNIITAVLKAVKELISCPKVHALFFAKWNSSWEIVTTLCNRLQVSNVNIPHKLILVILDDLKLIYETEHPEPYRDSCLQSFYLLLHALLEATKLEPTLANCRLLQEQKEVFDFLERFSINLSKNKGDLTSYIRFLLRFCSYITQDSHSDSLCRRALQGLETIIQRDPTCLVGVISEILTEFQSLLTLRFNSEALLLMSVTCKGAEPLYYFAGESFLKVLPYIMKLNCWDKILEVLEQLILPDEKLLNAINKAAFEEMMRTSERLDIQIIEFVKEHLIPASMSMQPSIQWRLISLLDRGCENYYQLIPSFERVTEGSFSSTCLSGLFELSMLRQSTLEEEEQKAVAEDPVHLKIAKKTAPVLINRCNELLRKFVAEEKMMGIMPLPRNRELELLKLLRMIKDLEIPEGSIERPGKKAHLAELYLVLSDLIVAKELEVKETLREVFIEVYKEFM